MAPPSPPPRSRPQRFGPRGRPPGAARRPRAPPDPSRPCRSRPRPVSRPSSPGPRPACARRLDFDGIANSAVAERTPDGRLDRDLAVARVNLTRTDQRVVQLLVLSELA